MGTKRKPPAVGTDVAPVATSPVREPTIKEWQDLVNAISEHPDELQVTVKHLLQAMPSGQAYLEYVSRYRPELRRCELSNLLELVTSFEARELLEQLIAEPRFGTDPDFLIWKDIWNDPGYGPSYIYADLIEFALAMEKELTNEDERTRLCVVREAVEVELRGEEYLERRRRNLDRSKP